ncbi:MAG: PAS domain-containing sensor histidine kinase [Sulfurovum sp.]|jgi:two-component system sensor histidine kinase KdpD|nr:MAG: PAS domain-containing sensor histidine kinase [Sulfurovum sp.]
MSSKKIQLVKSFSLLAFITTVSLLFIDKLNLLNIAMLFMIPILFSALYNEKIEVLILSIIAVGLFDVLFIPPRFKITVHDSNYILSFIIMIIIGQIIVSLAQKASKLQELEMSRQIQDALLKSLSHELRTPLSIIKGCSSVLLENALSINEKEKMSLLKTIDENTEEMEQHITNLINSAKLKNGQLHLKKDICDVEEIISTALLKTEKNNVFASLDIDENISPIYANAIFIEQAIINLLDNAFKYGTDVKLIAKEEINAISIEVINSGDIPSQKEINEATQAFVRLSNSYTKRGLGLGLHVVKLIAQIHNASLLLSIKEKHFCAKLSFSKVY